MIDHILSYWFGNSSEEAVDPDCRRKWFSGGEAVDQEIRQQFGAAWEQAMAGEHDDWTTEPRGRLALVILLDQMTRNIHRGGPAAFSGDEKALAVVKEGLANGHHFELSTVEKSFFYMPLEHSELLADQLHCIKLFEELLEETPDSLKREIQGSLDYARHHAEIIERFNRFPHRNEVLGRESTEEERAYLDGGGARFGQ